MSPFSLYFLDLVVIFARTMVLVRLLVPAKTPGLALTVADSKLTVSRILMTDLFVIYTWSQVLSVSATGLSTIDERLLEECWAVVRSVDVTHLPLAAELDTTTTTNPTLPIVETVSDYDPMLAGDHQCLSFGISVLSGVTSPMHP
jgi:hypothetical protein